MTVLAVPAIGSTSIGGSHIDRQRLVNLYAVDSKGQAIRNVPGTTKVAEAGNGPIRGFLRFGENLLVASGSSVYSLNSGLAPTPAGTLQDETGPVVMIENSLEALVIDGLGNGYRWNGSDYVGILDDDFEDLQPTTGVFHDGYAVVNKRGTGEVYISGLYDFSTWSALDFATAETSSDPVTQIESDKSLLWIFGTETLEVWQNTGNADYPFEPIRSITSRYGAISGTVQRIDNTLFWIGENEKGGRAVVRLVSNADPVVISDQEMNDWLADLPYSEFSSVATEAIWWKGQSWYLVTFKTADTFGKTLVFDSNGGNFEWSRLGPTPDTLAHAPFFKHVYYNGRHLVGDWSNGNIYELSGFTNNGDRIVKERIFRAIRANGMPLKFAKVEAEMETGVGTDDATMAMYVSYDGGRTWGNPRTKSIGDQGEYNKRVTWHRCGQGRNTVFRFRTTAERDIRMTGLKVTANT